MEYSNEFKEGWMASKSGRSKSFNPYKNIDVEEEKALDWQKGWEAQFYREVVSL